MEMTGELVEIGSLLPPSASWGPNPSLHADRQWWVSTYWWTWWHLETLSCFQVCKKRKWFFRIIFPVKTEEWLSDFYLLGKSSGQTCRRAPRSEALWLVQWEGETPGCCVKLTKPNQHGFICLNVYTCSSMTLIFHDSTMSFHFLFPFRIPFKVKCV